MAVYLGVPPMGLVRTTNIVQPGVDYSASFWWWWGQDAPPTYRTGFYIGDDPVTTYDSYVGVYNFPAASRAFYAEIHNAAAIQAQQSLGYLPNQIAFPVAYTRTGITHRIYVNYELLLEADYDFGAAVWTHLYLGTDTSAVGPDHKLFGFKEWNGRALSFNELCREWARDTVTATANLWTSTPLLTDPDDVSGNNHDWTEDGAVTYTATTRPRIPIPGIGHRATSAVATGTTSLTITKPTGTVNGDLMVLCLSHRSSAYATVPAGWELVAREIESGANIRGEMYWKYASGEGASYSITGLNDSACGFIISYNGATQTGGLLLNRAVARANLSGSSGTPAIGVLAPGSLVVFMVARASASTGSPSFSIFDNGTNAFARPDPDLVGIVPVRQGGGTSLGSDCSIAAVEALKLVPGNTIAGSVVSMSPAAANVGILAAFIPNEGSPGTRYYFGNVVPPTLPARVPWLPSGSWIASFFDGASTDTDALVSTQLLTRSKSFSGRWAQQTLSTNLQGNADILIGRWITPPLEAQTFSGTVNFTFALAVRWLSTLGYTLDTEAKLKIHVYVTVGQTGVTRSVLLSNHVNPTEIPRGGAVTWRCLDSGQSIAGSCLAGDSIAVEIGLRIVSSPTPTPTYPPTEWSEITGLIYGGAATPDLSSSQTVTRVAYADDAVVGGTTTTQIPFIDFTDVLVEQDLDAPLPENTAPDLALVMPAVTPADSGALVDVSASPSNGRAVWFAWTPVRTGTAIITTFLSVGVGRIDVWTGDPTSYTGLIDTDPYTDNIGMGAYRSGAFAILDVDAGVTYYIRVYMHQSVGAGVRVSITHQEAPEEDDLFVASRYFACYREGVLINLSADLRSIIPSGLAIDYTQRPMQSLAGGVNTNYRLYLANFTNPIIEIVDLTTFNRDTPEIDYIDAPLVLNGGGATDQLAAIQLTRSGTLYQQTFGNGFLVVFGTAAGIPAYLSAVSNLAKFSAIRAIDAAHADNQPGAPFPLAEELTPIPETTSPWHGALDESTGILYYSSGGLYFPVGTAQTVKRYNVTTQTQLPDLVTLPAFGTNPGLKGMAVILGDLFVCNGDRVHRLSSSGAITQTFIPTSDGYSRTCIDVKLTADGTHIWILDNLTTDLFKFSLLTGAQVLHVETGLSIGNAIQLALFAPTEPPPPPPPGGPGCPVDFPVDSPSDGACPVEWAP